MCCLLTASHYYLNRCWPRSAIPCDFEINKCLFLSCYVIPYYIMNLGCCHRIVIKKNIERRTWHTIVLLLNAKPWQIIHASDLKIQVALSTCIFIIITWQRGKPQHLQCLCGQMTYLINKICLVWMLLDDSIHNLHDRIMLVMGSPCWDY